MMKNYSTTRLPRGCTLQQDGAPAHYTNPVKAFLDQQFPDKSIGKGGGGPVSWPSGSPHLTALVFLLWAYIKDLVYPTKVQDVEELHHGITAACETVTPVMLQNPWSEVECRLDTCRATKGAHLETY
jgi:hypothetical protein